MKGLGFVEKWEKTHKIGSTLYILKYAILIPSGSFFGKCVGDYIVTEILLKQINLQDVVALVFLSCFGLLIGRYSWKKNENIYVKLRMNIEDKKV